MRTPNFHREGAKTAKKDMILSGGLNLVEPLGNVLFLGLLVVIFYWKVLFGHSIFVFVDASRFFYPLWKWGAGVLHQGLVPLWNPDAQFGTPYLADPQMAYAYPPVPLLYLLLDPTSAFAGLIILHHFWALAGFWFLARSEGFSARAALFGSLVFGFSLHVICSSWTPVALMSISWTPWIFLGAGKLYRGEREGFLTLSFTWAMQLAAGYPVLTYLTGLALGLHFGWKTLLPLLASRGTKRGPEAPMKWRWLGKFGLAACVAAAYNLVWGLPFLELYGLSNYQNGANHFQDLHWLDLATAFSPFTQGHPLGADYHGPHYWVATYFVGLPTLCLAVWGGWNFLYRRTSWGLLPLFVVLSCGGMGSSELLRAVLPGYALVIHSGFWISLLTLWVGLLAAESMDILAGSYDLRGKRFSWILVALAVYGIALWIGKPDWPVPFFLSFSFLVLLPFFTRPVFRWGFLAASLGFSVGPAAHSINILLDRSYYDEPPKLLAGLPKDGRFFFSPALMDRAHILQGGSMAQAYEGAKQGLYPNWPLAFGREEAPFYNTFQLSDTGAWTMKPPFLYSQAHSRNQLNFLGIRYVFGKTSFADLRAVHMPGMPEDVSENPAPLPKWFAVEEAFGGAYDVGSFLGEKGAAIRFEKECLIEDGSKAGAYHPRKVTFAGQGPDRIAIEALGKGDALLVSSETAYPGWKAWVDGKGAELERVNYSFRGIVMKDGEEKARLSYEPVPFRLGLFTALLVLGFWSALFLRGRMKS